MACTLPVDVQADREVRATEARARAAGYTYETRQCPCGRLFRTQTTATRMTCRPRVLECTVPVEIRRAHVHERWRVQNLRYQRKYQARVRAFIAERSAFMERMDASGWVPRSQRGRADPLLELDEQTRAEVVALIEEQRIDAERRQVQYAPSLDARLEHDPDGSATASRLGAVHFDRDDDRWPYTAARARRSRVLTR